MNYKNFNDYELLDYVHGCNEDANEILLYKYRPLIVNIANRFIKYCQGGVDINDLIQEGMLGFNDAVNFFDDKKEANFGTYAKICVERRIIGVVKNTKRMKNKILNESVPLESDNDELIIDKFLMDKESNPSLMVEDFDWQQQVVEKLNIQLTDLEKQVFDLKKNDFNYKEIADILEKDPKVIDNTLQRIKTKLKNIMKNS
ncbi:MAG: sigma-70 family RNA polymerase sigma factor [Bacilli bacterium]